MVVETKEKTTRGYRNVSMIEMLWNDEIVD